MATQTSKALLFNKKQVPKEFNNVSKSYDFATSLSQGYQSDLNRSASLLNLKGDEQVLDLCCGTGKSTAGIFQYLKTGKVIGVDNSEGMLEEAKKKYANEIKEGKVDFILQDAMDLNFEANSFDAIFVAYGLRNMPDYDQFLQGLHKILKPGGRLVIHDYSLKNKGWAKLYWQFLGYVFIVPISALASGSSTIFTYLIKSVSHFLTPKEVKEHLSRNGFQEVAAKPAPFWRNPILSSFVGVKNK